MPFVNQQGDSASRPQTDVKVLPLPDNTSMAVAMARVQLPSVPEVVQAAEPVLEVVADSLEDFAKNKAKRLILKVIALIGAELLHVLIDELAPREPKVVKPKRVRAPKPTKPKASPKKAKVQ